MFAVYPQEVFNNSNQKNTALYLRISKFIKGIVFFSNMGTYYTSLYPPHVMKGLGAPPKGFFCFSFLWNMWSMSLMFRFQFQCSYLLFSFPASFLNASSHFQGWDILVPGGQRSVLTSLAGRCAPGGGLLFLQVVLLLIPAATPATTHHGATPSWNTHLHHITWTPTQKGFKKEKTTCFHCPILKHTYASPSKKLQNSDTQEIQLYHCCSLW